MSDHPLVAKAKAFVISPNHPALSVGLLIFTFVILIVNILTGNSISNALALLPSLLFSLQLNNLSFYSMLHNDILHWLFNMLALFLPLSAFERSHGTVHTGVTLNLLTVIAGIQYCLVGSIVCPNTQVIGISGIVFLLMTFTAFHEHTVKPVLHVARISGHSLQIPTLYSPFLVLAVTAILFPGSLFWGHLAGISTGYLLAKGYLKVLYPPSWIILAIEKRLATPISKLAPLVVFYREEDAVGVRELGYVSAWTQDEESRFHDEPARPQFSGEGRALNETESQ